MTTSKGGRKATGSVRVLRHKLTGLKCWHGRFTLADGSRTDFRALDREPPIPLTDRPAAEAYAAEVATIVVRDGIVPEHVKETVGEYAARWLDDREGRVKSLRSDRARMRLYVLPTLGLLDVRTFTRDDVEGLRDALDRKITRGELAWKTAANVWTLATSMANDLVNAKKREFRVRDDNPARDVKPPERGTRKAKQYLYPSEFLTFVTCERIPLRWRRAVALAVYTYARDGELRALRWDGGDVDVKHGVLSITRAYNQGTRRAEQTKTGATRRFSVEPNLMPLLGAMRREARGKGAVIILSAQVNMARKLRMYLKKAGVLRPELHKRTPTRAPLTFHDLRATGITWCAVRGDDPLKIKQRAGHATFQTTEGYIREGEAVREGFGDVFPPLPACLLGRGGSFGPVSARPELKTKSSQNQGVSRTEGGTRTLTPFRMADFESAASAIPPLRPGPGHPLARKRTRSG
jgi:integrase